MDEQTKTADQNELLPLLVLAPRPPGSAEPLAKSTQGDRSTMLYRSEFGYDCRYDTPQQQYVTRPYERERPERNWFGIIAAVSLLLAVGLVLLQPAARDAMSGLFSGHHTSATAQPTPDGGVLGANTGDGGSAVDEGGDTGAGTTDGAANPGTSAQSNTSGTKPSGTTGGAKPVLLTGSYSVDSGGKASTTCTQGVAGGGICTWTINHTAGDGLNMKVSWTGSAKVAINVGDSVGNVYYSGNSTKSPINAPITNSGQSINITVTITGTAKTDFTVALSNA